MLREALARDRQVRDLRKEGRGRGAGQLVTVDQSDLSDFRDREVRTRV